MIEPRGGRVFTLLVNDSNVADCLDDAAIKDEMGGQRLIELVHEASGCVRLAYVRTHDYPYVVNELRQKYDVRPGSHRL